MRFHPSVSRLPRAIFTSVATLVMLVSCSDNTAPRNTSELDPSGSIEVIVPESVKLAYYSELTGAEAAGMNRSLMLGSATVSEGSVASFSVPASPRPYTKSRITFAPEQAPSNIVPALTDDGLFRGIPIGFDFEFYGSVYNQFNLYMNGFITFDPTVPVGPMGDTLGFWTADSIPKGATPNSMIALAWSDWQPNKLPGSIRYETRGTAPNRRFILQFTNVPEYNGIGRLTSQLVLEEGSNTVTINTTSMKMTRFRNTATQGIENTIGTRAVYDSVQNPVTLVWTERMRKSFSLTNDALRFYPPAPNKAPVVIAPQHISVNTAPASCAASVMDLGTATFSDDGPNAVLLSPVRSDGEPLDATYPRGVTTIAWTSVDAEEARTTVNQNVTVSDRENPSINAPASITADNDAGLGSAAVATGSPDGADNCNTVAFAGERSDGAAVSAPYPVGLTTITWTASDKSGNRAVATQTVTVRDAEAPSISGSDISVDATSRAGAAVTFATATSDNVGVVTVSCTRLSGSVFPAGSTPVTCTAFDAAGNRASDSFVVTVRGAAEQIAAVIGAVENLELSGGVVNPMLNQLRHALDDVQDVDGPDASCKKIEDFVRMLTSVKTSSKLTWTQVSDILVDIRRIQTVLGCQ